MNIFQLISVAAATLTITSCAANADQKLCESAIMSSLLNPETAKILDFESVSREELKGRITSYVKEKLPSDTRDLVSDEAIEREMNKHNLGTSEAKYYSARVRAEGKLGNIVTSVQTCFVEDGKCDCSGLDDG